VEPSKASNNLSSSPRPHVWKLVCRKAVGWLLDRTVLFEALLVALSLHVLLLPVLWVMGWALPWPTGPAIETIVEYDLSNWPNIGKPKRIYEIFHGQPDPFSK
jgi:hypothetical protein